MLVCLITLLITLLYTLVFIKDKNMDTWFSTIFTVSMLVVLMFLGNLN